MPIKKNQRVTNRLLALLPPKHRKKLLAQCETVELRFGERLYETGEPIDYVYFPLTGFISVVATLVGHPPLEMGLIGNEGMLGATLALGLDLAPMRAVVQGGGTALRLTEAQFSRELWINRPLEPLLDRYLYVMLSQLARSTACTRFHEIDPRLARWLTMTHDRAHADRFYLTHEYLAGMLGVRRSGVSIAAQALQAKQLIRYKRGEITILDRTGLENECCECYGAMQSDYARVFAGRDSRLHRRRGV